MQTRPVGGAALSLHAWSGSRGVDAVVTPLVLATSRPSVSAPSNDRTGPSAMASVRACGENEGSSGQSDDAGVFPLLSATEGRPLCPASHVSGYVSRFGRRSPASRYPRGARLARDVFEMLVPGAKQTWPGCDSWGPRPWSRGAPASRAALGPRLSCSTGLRSGLVRTARSGCRQGLVRGFVCCQCR